MYNFCECITMHVIIEQDKDRKWKYQANYTMGIHICMDFFRYSGSKPPPDAEELISHYILPIRPNRADRRKVETKPLYFSYIVWHKAEETLSDCCV